MACPKCGADGDGLCSICRAVQNTKANAAMSRIMAIASAELMVEREFGELATIRTLPEMTVIRSVVGIGSDLGTELGETIAGLPDGMYLLTKGRPHAPLNYVLEKVAGIVDTVPVPPEALDHLPALASAVLEGQPIGR